MKTVEKYTQEIIEDLFLRACKSKGNIAQVESLYRKFFYKKIEYKALAKIMINLYNSRISHPLNLLSFIDSISPYKIDLYQNITHASDEDYYKQIVIVIVSRIAILPIHTIKDYKIPAYWRNYERYENNISTKSN